MLKFGRELRTPAMQAGLVHRRLSFRDVFTASAEIALFLPVLIYIPSVPRGLGQRRLAA